MFKISTSGLAVADTHAWSYDLKAVFKRYYYYYYSKHCRCLSLCGRPNRLKCIS